MSTTEDAALPSALVETVGLIRAFQTRKGRLAPPLLLQLLSFPVTTHFPARVARVLSAPSNNIQLALQPNVPAST